jgi:hypothetical protein
MFSFASEQNTSPDGIHIDPQAPTRVSRIYPLNPKSRNLFSPIRIGLDAA